MRRNDEDEALPPPLRDGRGRTAALVRAYLRGARVDRAPFDVARLNARLAKAGLASAGPRDGARRRVVVLAWAAGIAGAFAGLCLLVVPVRPSPGAAQQPRLRKPAAGALADSPAGPGQIGPVASPGTAALVSMPGTRRPAPTMPVVRAGQRAVALAAGASWLDRDARLTLSPDARARAAWGRGGARVALDVGRIALEVAPQPPDRRLEVSAPPYRFVVHGTRFEVARGRDVVTLTVTEGAVSVHRGARRLAMVSGGEKWAGALVLPPAALQAWTAPPAPAPSPVRGGPASVLPAAPGLDDCRSSARSADALDCYRRLAARDGLAAEVALYEAAALCRDRLGDAERSLALLREHRARFPAGALAPEVSVSIVEILPRLGQHRQALAESTALLAAEPDGANAAELHLLRGTAYREGLGDCARAEAEYALAARGRTAPAASFWRGVCLEQLGRFDEAAAAYRAVGSADARFAAQALARLEALDREHRDQRGLQGR
jgi:hypothetical protein